jgi:accessory colonization factor AcfC
LAIGNSLGMGIIATKGIVSALGVSLSVSAGETLSDLIQTDAAIVWHFYQVHAPDQIQVIFLPPEQLTGIGEMQIAVASYCRDKEAAGRFIDFITSDVGREVFRRHGYFTSAEEVSQYWH